MRVVTRQSDVGNRALELSDCWREHHPFEPPKHKPSQGVRGRVHLRKAISFARLCFGITDAGKQT